MTTAPPPDWEASETPIFDVLLDEAPDLTAILVTQPPELPRQTAAVDWQDYTRRLGNAAHLNAARMLEPSA